MGIYTVMGHCGGGNEEGGDLDAESDVELKFRVAAAAPLRGFFQASGYAGGL